MTEGAPTDLSRAWVDALRGRSGTRQEATADLHALLTRGARFALSRSRPGLGEIPSDEVDALATQAADAALREVVASLDSFRGRSRFTTWASKFAIREAAATRAAGSSLPRSAVSDPWR
jgi:RNA polymerase sigma-70 factor (ECF subfamily)